PSAPEDSGPDDAVTDTFLSGLALSVGTLEPPFDPEIGTYAVAVVSSDSRLSVTATVARGMPSLWLMGPGLGPEGEPFEAGVESPSVLLSEGDNLIKILLTAADSSHTRAYNITATRAGTPPDTRFCPTVDRGDPTDGVTTITVVQPPAPCNAGPLWAGWHCTVLQSAANNNGVVYTVEARWNRVGQPVRGSFTWVTGNDSSTHWREGNNLSASVQDQLDTVDEVRTIDLAWSGMGTKTPPRNGFVNLSAVYADVVEHLVATGVAEGVLGHFGNSGGATLGCNALVNHGMHEVWDGVVAGGGPFWIDLVYLCGSGASQGTRVLIDEWTWFEVNNDTPCARGSGAQPSFACMSLIGPDSVFDFPHTTVSLVTGDTESAFITTEAGVFYRAITARTKTRDFPVAPHNVLKTQSGAAVVLQRIRDVVDAGSTRGDGNR
ncbi:MAG: cadherin-like beta sandwich domain-containing protein, partial [Gemmatimonadetes bacterium]|nr:cadherin-like beta sandwich domain-containing protein [Gemmatimonadota bacterium]